MRDKKRIPIILSQLGKIWKDRPDLRLGQLIGNYIDSGVMYFVEDEQLMDLLKEGYKHNARRPKKRITRKV